MAEQLTKEHTGTDVLVEPGPPAPVRIAWAPVPKVNLLPIEILENRRFRRTQILLFSVVLAALVFAGAASFWAQRSVDDANHDLVASQARVSTLQTEQTRYAAVPLVVAQVDAATAARTLAMGTDVLWYRYLNELDNARPAGIELSGITVAMNTAGSTAGSASNPLAATGVGTLVLGGTADQYNEISSWLEALNKVTGLSSSALTNAAKDQGAISFSSSAVVDSDALSGRYNKKAG